MSKKVSADDARQPERIREFLEQFISQMGVADPPAPVAPGVYIGSLRTLADRSALVGIDAVVNLSGLPHDVGLPQLCLFMDDAPVAPHDMDQYIRIFAEGVAEIRARRAMGQTVLVNCAAGINRSATCIAFYLIGAGWSYDRVYAALVAANDTRGLPVLTNDSFRYLLQARSAFKYFDARPSNGGIYGIIARLRAIMRPTILARGAART